MSRDLMQRELETLRDTVADLTHRLELLTDSFVAFELQGLDSIGLTRHEAAIVKIMHDNLGKSITKERLHGAIYAMRVTDSEVPEPKIIDVFICKIRRKLSGTPWEIKTNWGFGYSLHKKGGAGDGV